MDLAIRILASKRGKLMQWAAALFALLTDVQSIIDGLLSLKDLLPIF